MSIDFIRPEVEELRPRISVIGVGGAGGNAIANMIIPMSGRRLHRRQYARSLSTTASRTQDQLASGSLRASARVPGRKRKAAADRR